MGFKTIDNKVSFRKWNDWEKEDCVAGFFIEESVDKTYGKPQYKIDVTDCSWDEKLVGTKLMLNGAGKLNANLPSVPKGTKIRVTFNGKSVMESGIHEGKEVNDITLDVDQDDILDGIVAAQEKVNAASTPMTSEEEAKALGL